MHRTLHPISAILIAGLLLVAACDHSPYIVEDLEDSSVEALVHQIYTEITIPISHKLAAISEDDLRRLQLAGRNYMSQMGAKGLGEPDPEHIEEVLSRFFSDSLRARLSQLVDDLLYNHPRVAELSESELRQLVHSTLTSTAPTAGKTSDACQAGCTIEATASIIAIEAAFVGASIGCAALTAGYALCLGAALIAKNAGLVAVGASLVNCIGSCEAQDMPL